MDVALIIGGGIILSVLLVVLLARPRPRGYPSPTKAPTSLPKVEPGPAPGARTRCFYGVEGCTWKKSQHEYGVGVGAEFTMLSMAHSTGKVTYEEIGS